MLHNDEQHIADTPQQVAAELYTIAKENDALDTIGVSTSWRWQEGVISRMPKASTVAAVLTKAFGTDNPVVWHTKVGNDLKSFIANTFGLDNKESIRTCEGVEDIYDTMFVISISSGEGVTRSELIYRFCSLKYAKSLDDDDDKDATFGLPNKSVLLGAFSSWAEKKLDKVLKKYDYVKKGDLYCMGVDCVRISSELNTRNAIEISRLRNKVVGFTSYFDMWRNLWFDLTDSEHMHIENKILSFVDELKDELISLDENRKVKDETLKARCFSLHATTIPSEKEGI